MNLQLTLSNELVQIVPLVASDFNELYAIASDELIWEQHPEKDRYKKDVFQDFFNTAMQSKSAFKIVDVKTGETIGSSRYYDLNKKQKSVAIGYTFIKKQILGTPKNEHSKHDQRSKGNKAKRAGR